MFANGSNLRVPSRAHIDRCGNALNATSGGDYARATTDIDFLTQNIRNDLDDIALIYVPIQGKEVYYFVNYIIFF